jgi:HEAT repeat protein
MADNRMRDSLMSTVVTHADTHLQDSTQDARPVLERLLDPALGALEAQALLAGLLAADDADAWSSLEAALPRLRPAVVLHFRKGLQRSTLRLDGILLSHPDPAVRAQVTRDLQIVNESTGLLLLLRAARDSFAGNARRACVALEASVRAKPLLLTEAPEASALAILGVLPATLTLEYVEQRNPEALRTLAVSALGDRRCAGAREVLLKAAVAGGTEVAIRATKSLLGLDAPEEDFLAIHASGPPQARVSCLEALGQRQGERGLELLLRSMGDELVAVRRVALAGLIRRNPAQLPAYLELALKDADEVLAGMALDAALQHDGTTELLLKLAADPDGAAGLPALAELARRGAAGELMQTRAPALLLWGATLTEVRRTRMVDGIMAVARHAAAAGQVAVFPGLIALGSSVIRGLRRTAGEALLTFGPAVRGDALAALVDTRDRDLLVTVARGLVESKDSRAFVPLLRITLECRGRMVPWAVKALADSELYSDVEALLQALHSPHSTARRAAAHRLMELKDPRAADGLLVVSADADVEVQLAAIEALVPFTAEREDVKARMLEVLQFGDLSVRQAACEALGVARVQEALPTLIGLLGNNFLRPRVTEALRLIGDRRGFIALRRLERRETRRKEMKARARAALPVEKS